MKTFMPLVSLAALTVLDAGPVGQVRAAHAAGFEAVGLRLQPLLATDIRVAGDARLEAELRAAMAQTGLKLLEVGVFPIKPDMDVAALSGVLALSAEFRARFVVCPVEDHDAGRRLATFRALCDLAATFGLACLVEFNPYSACRTLGEARELALSAERDNAGLVIDLLHLSRSGGSVEDLRKVEPHLLKLVHFCDAAPLPKGERTIDELRAESRTARRLPGDGVLPLADLLRAFPHGTPISVEAPSAAIAHLPAEERARRVLAATHRVLELSL
ncbi:MAG: sugar phosphate isomerase/epimerase [Hyphomicrobiales bacterium]|nr:sugar phosphate isomerase/epimerase [Hyphomicrobiales bacterium]